MKALAPLVGAALLIAACGSTELSDKQLRARASALCAATARQTNRIAATATPLAVDAFLNRGVVALRPTLEQLRAIRPPSDLADVYETSVDAFDKEVADLQLTVHRLKAGQDPVVAIKTLEQQLGPLEATANDGWETLDIPACVDR